MTKDKKRRNREKIIRTRVGERWSERSAGPTRWLSAKQFKFNFEHARLPWMFLNTEMTQCNVSFKAAI